MKNFYLKQIVEFKDVVDEQFLTDICIILHQTLAKKDTVSINKDDDIIINYTDVANFSMKIEVYGDGAISFASNGDEWSVPYQVELIEYYLNKGYYVLRKDSDQIIE